MMKTALILASIFYFAHPSFAGNTGPSVGQISIDAGDEVGAAPQDNVVEIQGTNARAITNAGPAYLGDTIVTHANQTVKLTFSDQSEVTISPNSSLKVVSFSAVNLNKEGFIFLNQGLIRALIEHTDQEKVHFKVQTRAATIGVRGTDFVTEAESDGNTHLYTLDGAVAFGHTDQDLEKASTHHVVQAGMQSDYRLGQALPSHPKAFSHEALHSKLQRISPTLARRVHAIHEQRLQKIRVAAPRNPLKRLKKHR